MRRICVAAAAAAVMAVCSVVPALAQSRVALVIANSAYQNAPPVATAAADAGLVATALKTAGFDVTRSNDLTTQNIGDTLGAFIGKVQAAGPNAVVFVYFSGYAVQGSADDHLVPVDAQINSAADVAPTTLPMSALIKALGDVPFRTDHRARRSARWRLWQGRRPTAAAGARADNRPSRFPARLFGGARQLRAGSQWAEQLLRHRPCDLAGAAGARHRAGFQGRASAGEPGHDRSAASVDDIGAR